MPAYNFKARFAGLVESGFKTHTIRSTDRGALPGDIAHLYTGQRTRYCKLLGREPLRHVLPVTIALLPNGEPYADIYVQHDSAKRLTQTSLEDFAIKDGFNSTSEFIDFFREQHGLPFSGYLHSWGELAIA